MKLSREEQKHIEQVIKAAGKPQEATAAPARRGKPASGVNTWATATAPNRPPTAPERRTREKQRLTRAVHTVYEKSTPTHRRLMEIRYWDRKGELLSWDWIAEQLHVSRRQAFNLRGHILQAVALQLGWGEDEEGSDEEGSDGECQEQG